MSLHGLSHCGGLRDALVGCLFSGGEGAIAAHSAEGQYKGEAGYALHCAAWSAGEFVGGYDPAPREFLFPGRWGRGHLHPTAADKILRLACGQVGLVGVSTHSFRRTALTSLSNGAVPLRVIQRISGHESLAALQRYLEVSEEQVERAIQAMRY